MSGTDPGLEPVTIGGPVPGPLRSNWEQAGVVWERVTWDEALDDIAARVRAAISDGGHLSAWTVAGHPDPKVVLVLPDYLHAGHVVAPHVRRIARDKDDGARLVVLDPRTSGAADLADVWLTPWPGSEAAVLLAVASALLRTGRFDAGCLRRWFDWRTYLTSRHPGAPVDFATFVERLTADHARYTFEFAAEEAQVPADRIEEIAELIGRCGGRLAAHVWRGAVADGQGGRQVSRALRLVLALTGGLGRSGGFAWFEALSDPDRPGLHVALTSTWPEAAALADYVLPAEGPGPQQAWADAEFWWRIGARQGMPEYRRSPVARREVDVEAGELVLAEYPAEAHGGPTLWLNTLDAARRGVVTGDLVRISTGSGYTVAEVRVTDDGVRPGVCAACTGVAAGRGRLRKVRLEFARPGDRCMS